jgi:hypothetical protein
MYNKPKHGPAPGERVRVCVGKGFPSLPNVPDRAVVLLKEWHSPGYTAEYGGKEFRIMLPQILQPIQITDGSLYCPDCHAKLFLRGELWVCSTRTCPFRCHKDSPAAFIE